MEVARLPSVVGCISRLQKRKNLLKKIDNYFNVNHTHNINKSRLAVEQRARHTGCCAPIRFFLRAHLLGEKIHGVERFAFSSRLTKRTGN